MLNLILVIVIITYVCKLLTLSFGNFLLRPILMGPVVGLLLGDLENGLLFGGYLEIVFLGFFGVGGAPPPEAELSGVVAVACAIDQGQQFAGVLASGLITGYCGLLLFMKVVKPFSSKMAVKEQADILAGNITGFENKHRLVIGMVPLFYVPLALLLAVVFIYGLFPLMELLPDSVTTFLAVFALMYPAVGLANLVKNELNRDALPFLILGFGVAGYLGTGSMVVLLLSGIVAYGLIYLVKESTKTAVTVDKNLTGAEEDEDDFF